jgi:hypothetical protein
VSLSRITQYGGGARSSSELSDFLDSLLESANVLGTERGATNRVAALGSSIQFSGAIPFSVGLEYAGEDNAYAGRYRLGATNFTVSLDLPILWKYFDATIGASEWQNSWYGHYLYPLGLSHEGRVIGHWFGDHRLFGDAIGGNSQTISVGWQGSSGYLRSTYRTLTHDVRWAGVGAQRPYKRMHMLDVSYSTHWRSHELKAGIVVGQDVFGDSFARFDASFDLAKSPIRFTRWVEDPHIDHSTTEIFVDVGLTYGTVVKILGVDIPNERTSASTQPHFAIGARRRVSDRSDLGVRVEVDEADGISLVSIRAVDYRYRIGRQLGVGAFFGAGRYDIGLPAYGYYFGVGVQIRDILPNWDIGIDFRLHEKLGRDKVLASDPPSTPDRTRVFYDVESISLSMSRRW